MITEITSMEDIQALVRAGFTDWKQYGDVNVQQHPVYPYFIFNYTQAAQFTGRWNFFETVSRGLILDAGGEIVARAFDKFFNWFEGGRHSRWHILSVTEKMDGSLGVLYRTPAEEYAVATRGSFTSEQARWATKFLQSHYDLSALEPQWTLLFEIVYPGNRVVVDYGQQENLYLIGARNRFTEDYMPAFPDLYGIGREFGFPMPRTYTFNSVEDIIAQTGVLDANQEGWVVEFSDGQRFKFKGDRYRELHKLITGISFKRTLEAVANGGLARLREDLPDEFFARVQEWADVIERVAGGTLAEVETAFAAAPQDSRKEFALWCKSSHPRLVKYLFAKLDGKPLLPMIYQHTDWSKHVTEKPALLEDI